MATDFFLHVGTRKSGTTTLQQIAEASRPELQAQGVSLPLGHMDDRAKVMRSVAAAVTDPGGRATLADYRARILASPTEKALFSAEGLAALSPEAARAFVESLEGIRTEVVVTARDLSRQIPSDWQQMAKGNDVPDYPTYCREIRERSGEAGTRYHRRFDIPEIARRWGGTLPAEQVHIVVLPRTRSDPQWLPRRFYELLGVDLARLTTPVAETNTGMSFPEANLLRRVVAALRERHDVTSRQIHRVVREHWSAPETRTSRPITVPADMVEWCAQESERQIEEIERAGWHVVGELADLRVPADLEPFDPGQSLEQELEVAVDRLSDWMAKDIRRAQGAAGRKEPGDKHPRRGSGGWAGVRSVLKRG